MMEYNIEDCILKSLIGDERNNALEFVAYLRANKMTFERGAGYWEDKFYWLIKFQNEYVCFILIGDSEDSGSPWTIWSDDSAYHWFEDFLLDEHMKETAWNQVDFCANCGSCSGGISKIIFGKAFDKVDNVCRTTFRFDNPSSKTVECAIKLMEIRKKDIETNGDCIQKEG